MRNQKRIEVIIHAWRLDTSRKRDRAHQPLRDPSRQNKLLSMVSALATTYSAPSEVTVKARPGREDGSHWSPSWGPIDMLLEEFHNGGRMNSAARGVFVDHLERPFDDCG